MLLPIVRSAQTISLPLDGFYRPGAYMPATVNGATAAVIRADSGVATKAPAGAGVAPVFVYSALADQVQCADQKLPLHALAADGRLVGCATRDEALVNDLFPGRHVITIDLDPTNPLPGPSIAWDALDAVVVDSIDPKRIGPLLATGMAIAVRTEAMPDQTWPWRRVRDAWVVWPNPVNAQPSLLGDAAYVPTYSWSPGRTGAERQMIVVIAILSSCLMLAIAMWRWRWSVALLVLFVALFCCGFAWWRAGHSDVMSMTTSRTDHIDGEVTQIDRWTYQTASVASPAEMPCDTITWPVFASPAHAALLNVVLECDGAGQPKRFVYQLPANARMAFVARSVSP